jgi:hypothetical protein
MTMHLLGPAYTTTNSRKRKSKMTTAKHTKIAMDWLDDCKFCKRLGIKPKTFEEYKQYRAGNYKPKLRGTPMPKYEVSNHREMYPSQVDTGVTFAKKPNVYTGERLVGIATMHKSNSVPVFSQEDAIEIATMRRG